MLIKINSLKGRDGGRKRNADSWKPKQVAAEAVIKIIVVVVIIISS